MPLAVLPVTPLDLAYPSAVQDVFAAGFTDPPNLALPLLHPGQDIFSPGFRKLRDEHATVYSASSDSRWQYSTKCIDTDPTVPTIQEVVDEKASFNGVTNGNVNETMAVDRRAAALATAPSAPGGGAVVGMATWEVYHRSRTPEEWMPPNGVTWLPEGSEERRQAEAFFVALWKKRAEIWEGRKYVCAYFLSLLPLIFALSFHICSLRNMSFYVRVCVYMTCDRDYMNRERNSNHAEGKYCANGRDFFFLRHQRSLLLNQETNARSFNTINCKYHGLNGANILEFTLK